MAPGTVNATRMGDLEAEMSARFLISEAEEGIAAFRAGEITFAEVLSIIDRAGRKSLLLMLPTWRPWFEEKC